MTFETVLIYSAVILTLGYVAGWRVGVLNERHRCADVARFAGDFCRDNATRPPIDLMSAAWAARHDEARLIEKKIRSSESRRETK